MKRNEVRLWDLWAIVWVIGVCEGEEKDKELKCLFKEILAVLSKFGERYKYLGTEMSKFSNQIESKQDYTKT